MADDRTPGAREAAEELPPGVDAVVRFATLNPELFEQIHTLIGKRAVARVRERQTNEYADLLKSRFRALHEQERFELGDLVYWKEGLKNRRRPDYGEPCIVLEVLEEAVMNPRDDPGSQLYRENLTLSIGILDEDDSKELMAFFVDGRRFSKTPWQAPEIEAGLAF